LASKIKRRTDYFAYSEGSEFSEKPMLTTFRTILQQKKWVNEQDQESLSGTGSSKTRTIHVLHALRSVIKKYVVSSMLDIPCGDYNWMSNLEKEHLIYTGAELLPEIVEKNNKRYGRENIQFRIMDITVDALPVHDLVFCRDCLVHFSYEDIYKALRRIYQSKGRFLLMTTFPAQETNEDIVTGGWRPLNFVQAPFQLPAPIELYNEHCTEGGGAFGDKSLGLWRIDDLARSSEDR